MTLGVYGLEYGENRRPAEPDEDRRLLREVTEPGELQAGRCERAGKPLGPDRFQEAPQVGIRDAAQAS
jgi:hypothetical protein